MGMTLDEVTRAALELSDDDLSQLLRTLWPVEKDRSRQRSAKGAKGLAVGDLVAIDASKVPPDRLKPRLPVGKVGKVVRFSGVFVVVAFENDRYRSWKLPGNWLGKVGR